MKIGYARKTARARERKGGRKKKLSSKQVEMARAMVNAPNISISAICKPFKISKPTLYRYVPAPRKLRKAQERRKNLIT